MPRPKMHISPALLCLVFAIGCTSNELQRTLRVAPDDWTTEGGTPAKSNSTVGPALELPLTQAWTYSAHAGALVQPLVRDSMLFVPTAQGELLVLSATTGRAVSNVKYASAIVASPVFAAGLLIIPFASGTESLVGADLRTGKTVWSVSKGPIEAAPLLKDGLLYAVTLSGTVICIDPSTGVERWNSPASDESRTVIRSSPAADSSRLFVGSVEGTVTAYRLSDGATQWHVQAGASIFAGLLVVRDVVIVATAGGETLCLDAGSGTVRWKASGGGAVYAAPSSDGTRVYIGSSDGTCSAFDAVTGLRRWTYRAKSNVSASPLVSGPTVFIGSFDRSLVAVTADSGREVWRWGAEGRVRASPVAWRGHLFIVTDDREITAFRGGQP